MKIFVIMQKLNDGNVIFTYRLFMQILRITENQIFQNTLNATESDAISKYKYVNVCIHVLFYFI